MIIWSFIMLRRVAIHHSYQIIAILRSISRDMKGNSSRTCRAPYQSSNEFPLSVSDGALIAEL
jgi:hypothetical protein